MSKRRMYSQQIVESDAFLDMPLSTQALYFHLGMNADDYGFISPKRIMRMIGANDDDLKLLIMKRFVLIFDSGVVVIKHWLLNNTVRQDRSHETTYQAEFKQLTNNEFGAYTELSHVAKVANEIAGIEKHIRSDVVTEMQGQVDTNTTKRRNSKKLNKTGEPLVAKMATEIRLDKIRLDKIRLSKNILPKGNIQKDDKNIPTIVINEMLEYWRLTIGYAVNNEPSNRKAIAALLRTLSDDQLKRLIDGVALSHSDQYAPRISDFISLKRKINDLIVWGKKKGASSAVAQF